MARKKWKDDPNSGLQEYCVDRRNFTIRPVTKNDKWCWFRKKKARGGQITSIPYGEILTVEYFKDSFLIKPNGYIVRSKVINGILYLQIVKGQENYRIYCINVSPQNGALNIINCTKGPRPIKYC